MRSVAPDPGRGGARGYDEHFRRNQIALHNQGQHQLLTASRSSLWRWRSNGIQRRKFDGNVAATTLRDNEDQLLLVLCRLAHPKAKADEIIAFIARNNSTGYIYSRVEITRAEKRLGFTRKVGSTTAWQALTPANVHRRQNFWTIPTGYLWNTALAAH